MLDQLPDGFSFSPNDASDWALGNDAARLDLLTEHSNIAGQHLYEKLGYKKVNENFFAYSLSPSSI